MTTLRVVVADDEPLVRERITDLVKGSPSLTLVGEASNGLEALDQVTRLTPDLLLIDVEMPELSGFAVISALEPDRIPGVVFITAFEHYALPAFDAGAIDYLHKPVTRQRFDLAIARACERLQRRSAVDVDALLASAAQLETKRGARERFVIRRGNTHYIVPVADVDWIDVADNYLRLHAGARVHLFRGTMKQAEDELDATRFVRIHRSVMIAVDRVRSIQSHELGGHVLELTSGVRLRGSRQYAGKVRQLMR